MKRRTFLAAAALGLGGCAAPARIDRRPFVRAPDVTLAPGEERSFTFRAFNTAAMRVLGASDPAVSFELDREATDPTPDVSLAQAGEDWRWEDATTVTVPVTARANPDAEPGTYALELYLLNRAAFGEEYDPEEDRNLTEVPVTVAE